MEGRKRLQKLQITSKACVGVGTYLLKVRPLEGERLPPLGAGQFVQILPPGDVTLLRRPISVCNYIPETNELWLLIAAIGCGTMAIVEAEEGDYLDVLLPLGNRFSVEGISAPLLIGGGVGTAPMLALARAFEARGIKADVLLGGRTGELVLLQEDFRAISNLYVTTDDGSLGLRGRVTDHPCMYEKAYDRIYTCGPHAMMHAVALIAHERDIDCEVSLENTMACGIGACLCCVQDTHSCGNVCVCTEGPVFNSRGIKW